MSNSAIEESDIFHDVLYPQPIVPNTDEVGSEKTKNTHMFPRFIDRAFHLVKIVFVELPYEACEIGVFEHFGKDRFGEFIRVLSVGIGKDCA